MLAASGSTRRCPQPRGRATSRLRRPAAAPARFGLLRVISQYAGAGRGPSPVGPPQQLPPPPGFQRQQQYQQPPPQQPTYQQPMPQQYQAGTMQPPVQQRNAVPPRRRIGARGPPQQQPPPAQPLGGGRLPQYTAAMAPAGMMQQQVAPPPEEVAPVSVQRGQGGSASELVLPRSLLMDKEVITRTSGNRLGYINQLFVDPASLAVVSCYLRKGASSLAASNSGHVMLASLRQISDVVLVHDDSALMDPPADDSVGYCRLVGAQVVTQAGQELGRVRDFLFDPDNGAISTIKYDALGIPLLPQALFSCYAISWEDVVAVGPTRVIVRIGTEARAIKENDGIVDDGLGLLADLLLSPARDPEEQARGALAAGAGGSGLSPEEDYRWRSSPTYRAWYEQYAQAYQDFHGVKPAPPIVAGGAPGMQQQQQQQQQQRQGRAPAPAAPRALPPPQSTPFAQALQQQAAQQAAQQYQQPYQQQLFQQQRQAVPAGGAGWGAQPPMQARQQQQQQQYAFPPQQPQGPPAGAQYGQMPPQQQQQPPFQRPAPARPMAPQQPPQQQQQQQARQPAPPAMQQQGQAQAARPMPAQPAPLPPQNGIPIIDRTPPPPYRRRDADGNYGTPPGAAPSALPPPQQQQQAPAMRQQVPMPLQQARQQVPQRPQVVEPDAVIPGGVQPVQGSGGSTGGVTQVAEYRQL